MRDFHLVRINADGSPAEPIGALHDIAKTVCASMQSLYGKVGFFAPWIGYLALDAALIVGTCAFKSPPKDNRVEVAYFTFPQYEHIGYATQMVRHLVDIAGKANPGIIVTAQTLPEENVSTAILRKTGFRWAGSVEHPEDGLVWEWWFSTAS